MGHGQLTTAVPKIICYLVLMGFWHCSVFFTMHQQQGSHVFLRIAASATSHDILVQGKVSKCQTLRRLSSA